VIDTPDNGIERLPVVPVAICYRGRGGIPMGRNIRTLYAWHGDTELAPHLLFVLGYGCIDIDVIIGAPVLAAPGTNRKQLTQQMEARVRRMLADCLTGR
jgi:1-acyl-sn-glycerol-3-phosphate acyltransferase